MNLPELTATAKPIPLTVDLERELAARAKVDPKTVRRWRDRLPMRRGTRERLDAAYSLLATDSARGAT